MFGEYLCGLKKIRFAGQCQEPQIEAEVWGHLGIDKTALVEVLSVINDEVDNAKNAAPNGHVMSDPPSQVSKSSKHANASATFRP